MLRTSDEALKDKVITTLRYALLGEEIDQLERE